MQKKLQKKRSKVRIASAVFVKGILGTNPICYNGLPQVAFVGRSNVGKSSLINALAGNKSLVKVSNKPGKTTEINFFLINGKSYLVDLPGYGYAKNNARGKTKLQKHIVWYLSASNIKPKKIVLVLDSRVGVTTLDKEMLEILRNEDHPFVIVANKTDKLSQKELHRKLALIRTITKTDVVKTSTVTLEGVHALLNDLAF